MSKSFDERSANIFGTLDDLEKKHEKFNEVSNHDGLDVKKLWKAPVDLPDLVSRKDSSGNNKEIRNEEFIRPSEPPRRHQAISRGRTSRGRWRPQSGYKHYSLADIDSLNESDNKAAAFAFLREKDEARRAKELAQLDAIDPEPTGGKILFKKKEDRVTKRLGSKKAVNNQPSSKKLSSGLSSKDKEILYSVDSSPTMTEISLPEIDTDNTSHTFTHKEESSSSESFGFKKIKSKNIRKRHDSDGDD